MREQRLLDAYQRLRQRVRRALAQADASRDRKGRFRGPLLEAVAVLPDLVHLAIRLLLDPAVGWRRKAPLALALAYLVSPVDLVVDVIPVVGLLDDVAVVAWALRRLLSTEDPQVAAAVARHWAGEEAALVVVQRALDALPGLLRLRASRRRPPGSPPSSGSA